MTAPAVIGWLVGRRQQKAATSASELDNVQKALGIWQEMNDGLKEENRMTRESLEAVKAQMADQEEEIKSLRHAFEKFVSSCPNNCPAPEIIKPKKLKSL